MDQHIIYRSRGEAVFDDFWWNVAAPWVGTHWLSVLCVLCVVVAGLIFIPPYLETRRWNRRRRRGF
jgi:hypothetical protein